ncbi:hypothetical protein ATY75_13310 [Rhizobium sp. N122]|nr:hypothetical protein ATY75_13310 [Rhizobium sp. N122]
MAAKLFPSGLKDVSKQEVDAAQAAVGDKVAPDKQAAVAQQLNTCENALESKEKCDVSAQ